MLYRIRERAKFPVLLLQEQILRLVKYTSAADSEFLYYGRCKCISKVPATPDGKPTPAIITRTALRLTNIPFLVVDAGARIKPSIPYISFNIDSGNNIKSLPAMSIVDVKRAFDYGVVLGDQISKNSDLIVIGESIPGGNHYRTSSFTCSWCRCQIQGE